MTKLSVNVNKIATLRNTRTIGIPCVARLSRICLDAGADGITIHPRPDQRHIRPADVHDLAKLVRQYPGRELNVEGNPFHEYEIYASQCRPTQCTLVPDAPEASTSDHGWDLSRNTGELAMMIQRLKSYGCRVSLFMDPNPDAMEAAKKLGVDRIELYTAPYAEGFQSADPRAARKYSETAIRAGQMGLGVNAGHDLNLQNLPEFLREVGSVLEVSIGHALIADALEFGLAETVRRYIAIVRSAR